jgi:hypothetical protein
MLLAAVATATGAPFLAALGISCTAIIVLHFAYGRAQRMRAAREHPGPRLSSS